MRTLILLLAVSFFSYNANAQEKVSITLAGVKHSFEGTKTFKATADNMQKCYYGYEDGQLSSYTLTYNEDAELFSYSTEDVILADLNLKSASISDMNSGSTLPFEGWLLTIETKKMKSTAIHSMYTFADPEPGIDKRSSISFLFNKKADAEKFLEELKSMLSEQKK